MNDDRNIRSALRGLRLAPIPAPPNIAAASPERMRVPLGMIAAAAAMLPVLFVLLWISPEHKPVEALSSRIASAESRLDLVEHEELRILLRREIELLRQELEWVTHEMNGKK